MKLAVEEKIFGSRIRAKILGWLFTHPDESFFVRQLANILKEDSTNLSRELSNLEEVGVLLSTRHGNLKYFQANKGCPFFDELKGLVLKTVGVVGMLKSALQEISDIEYAFIYGSYAKGNERADSDVDLMIIGDINLDRIDMLISDLERKINRTINYVTYDHDEFLTKKKAKDGFIMDVLKDKKIMLVGDENRLKKT